MIDDDVRFNYIPTDFLSAGSVSGRRVLKSPAVQWSHLFFLTVLSVFVSCALMVCC